MRRWKEEGSNTAGMDMNLLFSSVCMCLIMYVSLLLSTRQKKRDEERERERGADSLCYTKENLRERRNK